MRYFYRFAAVLVLLTFAGAYSAFAQCGGPADIGNVLAWFRADSNVTMASNNSNVLVWRDLSGNGFDAYAPSTTDSQPTRVTSCVMNNKPVINFANSTAPGKQMFKGHDSLPISHSSFTVFIVAMGNAQSASRYTGGLLKCGTITNGLWLYRRLTDQSFVFLNNYNTDANAYISSPTMPNAGFAFNVWSVRKTYGVKGEIFEDGALQVSSTYSKLVGPFTNAQFFIGNTQNIAGFDNFNGQIAEIIIFNRALSDSEMLCVNTYLHNRYVPPVNLGPDINESYRLCADTLRPSNCYSTYQWSTGSTASFIRVTQSGTYSLTATDVFGRTSADTINVAIPRVVLNTAVNLTICQGTPLTMSPQMSSGPYTYLWSNNATTSSVSPVAAGKYWVKLTDSLHCTLNSDTTNLKIDSLNSKISLGADTTLCRNSLISLKTPANGWNRLSFHWSTGSTDSIAVVTASGVYSVTVSDTTVCTASASKNINVLGSLAPTVNFSGDTICYLQNYLPVNLTAPTDSVASYYWTFGDGGSSSATNAAHFYQNSGVYSASLRVITLAGCTTTVNKYVIVDALPTASFNGGAGCVDNSYQFNDLSSPSSGSSLISWNWDFGDGGLATTQNPQYTYATSGSYTAGLMVTDNYGCSGHTSHSITLTGPQVFQPVSLTIPANWETFGTNGVLFAWNPTSGATSYTLQIATNPQFTNAQTYPGLTICRDSVGGFAGNTQYYWRIVAYSTCGDSSSSTTGTFRTFKPSDIGSGCLAVWLAGDNVTLSGSTTNVSTWLDTSGNAYHATATPGLPTWASEPQLNGHHVLHFSGTSQALKGPQIPGIDTKSFSIFMVDKGDNVTQSPAYGQGLFTINTLNAGMWLYRRTYYADLTFINNYSSIPSTNTQWLNINGFANTGYPYTLMGLRKDFGNWAQLDTNGVVGAYIDNSSGLNSILLGAFTNGPYYIGYASNFNQYFQGSIAETIVYTCVLDSDQANNVNNYLYTKYAPPVYLGPDTTETGSVCPVVLNAGARFISYLWSTGATTQTISVQQNGTYWVRVKDVFNRESSDTINVTLPYLGSTPGDTAICYGRQVQISQLFRGGSSYNYLWSNGATTSSITVSAAGAYSCTVSNTGNASCFILSDIVHVHVDSFALTNLLTTDTLLCTGSAVHLANTTYPIVSYLWSPSGDTSAAPLIYADGQYSLTVVDANGCFNTDTINVTTHSHAPITDFSASGICLGNATAFTSLAAVPQPDAIDSFHWAFDGAIPATASTANPVVNFSAYGLHQVSLFVQTDSGCTGTITKIDTIYPTPIAGFAYSGSNSAPSAAGVLCAGDNTFGIFSDSSLAIVAIDSIVSRVWEFDGVVVDSSNSSTIIHQFDNPGNYTVSLIVTNNEGCTDSVSRPVRVFAPLNADFYFQNVCYGQTTKFTDLTASYSLVSWSWTFGDNFTSTTQNPTHRYTQPLSFPATLTVQNAIGCIANITKTVTIYKNPVAAFTDTIACVGDAYTPVDLSQTFGDPIQYWSWNIAGHTYTTQAPQYTFTDTGTYTIRLKITTQNSCADSTSKHVYVAPIPVANFTYSPLYGSAPLTITLTNNSTGANWYLWDFGDGSTDSFNVNTNYIYQNNGDYTIVLYARNSYGCTDSFSRKYSVIATNLDLSVDRVWTYQTPQPNGYIFFTVVAQISNVQTRPITSAQLKATVGSSGVMIQDWTGYLLPGQTIIDTFPAQFDVAPANANSYVCVEGFNVNNGETETRYDNNQACASLNSSMQLVGPAPMPAVTQSTLGIILPAAGTVNIDIIDQLGQVIVNNESFTLPAGRSDYELPVQSLSAAEYYVRVRYQDDTQVRKLIVQ